MTLKQILWIAGGAVVILTIAALAIALIIQSNRLDKAKAEADKQDFNQATYRIVTEYIPAELDKLTTDELSRMGGVLWE